jgi:hypothetical protein
VLVSLGSFQHLLPRGRFEGLEAEVRPAGDVRPNDGQGDAGLVSERELHPPPVLFDDQATSLDRHRVRARTAVLMPAELEDLGTGDAGGRRRRAARGHEQQRETRYADEAPHRS